MPDSSRLLRIALVVFGVLMLLLYPIAVVLAVLMKSSGVEREFARDGRVDR